ncbi:glycerate kinase [Nocardioides jishulii]|uniref:Glycerate kinase n=1 Tax=Nocardioides jishulii TaxID=2575440 RepID=A0A4U2YLC0_9ACTN|nr:glycerate kinase [Nocardioides jishulii]QCX27110.1 glycerate kinase [Nocardioides jishulii]TKI61594.1 glycerate kinase [Nocardioides jishulii]
MRVLLAPDKFAGTLTAVEAAEAMATGWRRHDPRVEFDLAPMADGGPGFVDVLHTSLGGEVVETMVSGPHGRPTPGRVLVVSDVAYVESAQACGLHLSGEGEPRSATTYGVGELVRVALAAGVRRIVLGAGGSGTTDGGAGLLAALGATADVPLERGPAGLEGVSRVDLAPARTALGDVELVLASDVDNPLTGLFGAAKVYGPQKGLGEEELPEVDRLLEAFAVACDRRTSLEKGAGAAGGLGFAALLLGAQRRPGLDVVAEAVSLAERLRAADLVVTGEGAFDFSSRSGKVPYGVAQWAGEALRPCITLAGQVLVGAREMRALGMDAAYSMVEMVGEERSFADPAGALADLAERVARSWTVGE